MQTSVGVFLCNCGNSLRNIDFNKLEKDCKEMQNVVHTEVSSILCTKEELERIKKGIEEKSINRVIFCACSFKQKILQSSIAGDGSSSPIVSTLDLKELCSYLEGDATDNAALLIDTSIKAVNLLQPLPKKEFPVSTDVLVVGGSFSGLKTALEISKLGYNATLIEEQDPLESIGMENCEQSSTWKEQYKSLVEETKVYRNLRIITGAEVAGLDGVVGNFIVRIKTEGREKLYKFGAVVFATGHNVLSTEHSGLVSRSKFVAMLNGNIEKKPEAIALFLDEKSSRIATLSTLNDSIAAKETWGCEVCVLCKQLQVDSDGADKLYRRARDEGVLFFKYDEKPQMVSKEDRSELRFRDILLGEDIDFFCDLVVEYKAPEAKLSLGYLESTDSEGFYQRDNVYLFPVSSEKKGIFYAGSCRDDMDVKRALEDASSAAMSIHQTLPLSGKVWAEEEVTVNEEECRACLTCIRACPHGAISLKRSFIDREVANIFSPACSACGICVSLCPANAITIQKQSDEQFASEIEAIGRKNTKDKVVVFCCENSALPAINRAGAMGLHIPRNVTIISVPCAGRIDTESILQAFEYGIDKILIATCQKDACKHISGNLRAENRIYGIKGLLREMGMDESRVEITNIGPYMTYKLFTKIYDLAGEEVEA